ncbi:MAG: hypothetical protein ACRDIC_25665, partial [bacterium]
ALLDEIFMQTMWYYIGESADPSRPTPPPRIDEIRFTTLLHGMFVRSPAYASHWRDVLLELFGHGSTAEQLSAKHGLHVRSALSIIDSIESHISKVLDGRLQQAQTVYKETTEHLKQYMATGTFEGGEDEKTVLDRMRNMRAKDRKRYLECVVSEWTRVALGTVL